MQYAGTGLPVRPAGHLGGGTAAADALGGADADAVGTAEGTFVAAAVTVVAAEAEAVGAVPFVSSLSQAMQRARPHTTAIRVRISQQATPVASLLHQPSQSIAD
jgi:hypothetical protein